MCVLSGIEQGHGLFISSGGREGRALVSNHLATDGLSTVCFMWYTVGILPAIEA